MTTILRPMSTGEVLDRMFSLYRYNFVLFFGISTVPPAVYLLMQVVLYGIGRGSAGSAAQGSTIWLIVSAAGFLLGIAAYFVGLAVAQAATVFAVSAVHLGRPTTIRESYGRVWGRYGRVLNVVLSVTIRVFGGGFLILLAAMIVFIVPGAAFGRNASPLLVGALMFTGFVVAFVIFILLLLRYALAVPACVLEDIKARAAIKRSVSLSKGSRGRIFVIYFLFIVLEIVVLAGMAFVMGFAGASLASRPGLLTVLSDAIGFVVGALLGPIVTIATALVYYDQRVRKEAFDIQLMMAALDGPQPPAAAGAPAGSIG